VNKGVYGVRFIWQITTCKSTKVNEAWRCRTTYQGNDERWFEAQACSDGQDWIQAFEHCTEQEHFAWKAFKSLL